MLVLLFLTEAEGIDISATGGWTETVNSSDLVSGAGSNLIVTYESATNATIVSITNCLSRFDNWRVDVRRVDGGNWHANFTLSVRRTSNGTGLGSISGGLSYIGITTTDSQFFSGRGNRSNINLQYRLTGMSVSISPKNYSTTVVFTVVDI
jgi:hypothetical protein